VCVCVCVCVCKICKVLKRCRSSQRQDVHADRRARWLALMGAQGCPGGCAPGVIPNEQLSWAASGA